jgi:hypothetical protein
VQRYMPAVRRPVLVLILMAFSLLAARTQAHAQRVSQLLEFGYTPVARAQVAIWVEDANGTYLATVALTDAVAYRGLGNRPGASQMNSGYRWPYGRREGVLPIWAHRRAAAPGAKLFPRVIFQDRTEGFASRTASDQSPDDYHCLQFDASHSTRDQLDAVSCATQFSSDKGRYLRPADARSGYAEPWQDNGSAVMRALPEFSVYPPRMDVTRCTSPACFDSPDVANFARDARSVMPEIDAVTRATPPGGMPQRLLFDVPPAWPAGEYVAYIEVNVEGDYNEHWNDTNYPTPKAPTDAWDGYAVNYGYPYRGQPSILFALPFTLGDASNVRFATASPAGRSSWNHWSPDYGRVEPVSMRADDPVGMADVDGSGADRLQRDAQGTRFSVTVKTVESPTAPPTGVVVPGSETPPTGNGAAGPGPVSALTLRRHSNELRAHTWIVLRFQAAHSGQRIHAYDVRVATEPILDAGSFIRDGRPAKNATDDVEGATALMLPVDVPEGGVIEAAVGDLVASTHYWIGVRATDDSNRSGPISVAEIDTPERTFATVTPCVIATAAYGTPLAAEISVLRRVRDRNLMALAPGRALVDTYYALGPRAAEVVARHATLRSIVRAVLSPLVAAIGWLSH